MSFKDHFLPEFDQEMATTRRTLERVPYDKADWKPHEKSMAMGRLAVTSLNFPASGWRPSRPTCWISPRQV